MSSPDQETTLASKLNTIGSVGRIVRLGTLQRKIADGIQFRSVAEDQGTLWKPAVADGRADFVKSSAWHIAYLSSVVFGHIFMLPVPSHVATGIFQIRCMGDSPSYSFRANGLENHCLSCPEVVGGCEVVL